MVKWRWIDGWLLSGWCFQIFFLNDIVVLATITMRFCFLVSVTHMILYLFMIDRFSYHHTGNPTKVSYRLLIAVGNIGSVLGTSPMCSSRVGWLTNVCVAYNHQPVQIFVHVIVFGSPAWFRHLKRWKPKSTTTRRTGRFGGTQSWFFIMNHDPAWLLIKDSLIIYQLWWF